MNKIDEQFIKEKVNPVVGFIFHTARQLGQDNAPNSMDMEYLRQGTEKVCQLLAAANPADPDEQGRDKARLKAWNESGSKLVNSENASAHTCWIQGFHAGYSARTADPIAAFVKEVEENVGKGEGQYGEGIDDVIFEMRAVMERRTTPAAKDDGRQE